MSFFRYPGGKSKLRSQITNTLYKCFPLREFEYREPFFGGGSIGLDIISNKKASNVWLNDKDIGVACIWSAVISYPEQLKNYINGFTPSVDKFYEYKKFLESLDEMPTNNEEITETAFKKIAIHQISYSGLGLKAGGPLGGKIQKSKYKIDCRWSVDYLYRKIDNLHAQFKNVSIKSGGCTNLDFEEVVNNNSVMAVMYLDPPYYVKGNDLYYCGFAIEDHKRLAKTLKHTPHSWVLSYDDCPEVRQLYSWANIESTEVNYSITATKDKSTGKRLSRNKNELIIWKS